MTERLCTALNSDAGQLCAGILVLILMIGGLGT